MKKLEMIIDDMQELIAESDSLLVKSRLKQACDSLISANNVMDVRFDINHLGLNDERVGDRRCNN